MRSHALGVAGLVLVWLAVQPLAAEARHEEAPSRKAMKAQARASALAVTALAVAPVKTVTVRCDRGEKIGGALAKNPGPLVVEVRGICAENVLVERNDLTFHGLDPAVDGLRGVVPASSSGTVVDPGALSLVNAARIRLENLSFSDGATHGVTADRSSLTVVNCRAERNVYDGFRISASVMSGEGVVASANATHGIHSDAGANVACAGCVLQDNGAYAAISGAGGFLTLGDSLVSGVRGITAWNAGSYVDVDCVNTGLGTPCSVSVVLANGTPGVAASSTDGGTAALWGVVDFVGTVQGTGWGRVDVVGSRQAPLPAGKQNQLWDFSVLLTDVADGYTTAIGRTTLGNFSHAILYQTELLGTFGCVTGSDAVSDVEQPVAKVSGCQNVPTY